VEGIQAMQAWTSLKRGFGTGGGRNWGALLGVIVHRPRFNMAWNVFKLCTGLKVLGSVMILVVLSVVGVSYYAVVITNYMPQVMKGGSATATSLLVLILFHVLVQCSLSLSLFDCFT